MAARRLLIIMLVLLGISSALAIALPNPGRDDSDEPETTATGETGATGSTSEQDSGAAGKGTETGEPESAVATGGLDEGTSEVTVSLDVKKPQEIKAKAGSRLILKVESESGAEVEVTGLGLTGFSDQFAPAVFDLLLPATPERFRIQAVNGGGNATPAAVIDTSL